MSSELASEHTCLPRSPSIRPRPTCSLATAACSHRENSGDGDIQTLAVAPEARRHGLGRTLVTALLAEAASRGAHEVFLEVRADNPNARALYDSLGFEQIAVRAKYYQPDGVDAQIMRVRL